jgi:predicted Zn-dependent peptidase
MKLFFRLLAAFAPLILTSCSAPVAAPPVAAAIPDRPEKIAFQPLAYEPPAAAEFRHVLPDGTVVYLAPSHEFPLVNLAITFKGGASLDPADAPGLAGLTARMVREGGTAKLSPAELDETLDFLATEAAVSANETFTTATLNTLTSNFDESLGLFLDMLRTPRFDQGRLDTAKARAIEGLKQRNDDAASILSREWKRLVYGTDHFESAEPTGASVEAISRDRLTEMHGRVFHPGNAIVAVSGDFEPQAMLAKLEKAFTGWERGGVAPDPARPTATLEPGLYHVPKEIPQGKVVLGCRSIERDDPDAIPLLLLNEILGAGGFTSRLMQQVRSNEGLAYSVRSAITPRVTYPGDFRAADAAGVRQRRVDGPAEGFLADVSQQGRRRDSGGSAAGGAKAPRSGEDGDPGGGRLERDRQGGPRQTGDDERLLRRPGEAPPAPRPAYPGAPAGRVGPLLRNGLPVTE